MPHTLRSLRLADEQLAELTMLCGFDDDLAAQVTQTSNRIRGLLTQIHPALERVLGPRLDHPAVLDLLERYPSPSALAAASEKTLANRLIKLAPRMGKNLAAYAGLAPVTRRSGSSIRGEHPSRRGNKVLKRALFLSAFAALRDPVSRAYYTRKVQQGKRHNQALIALAWRRCDVLFAMLRDSTIYQPKSAPNA
ncbi:hypothetical protein WI84_07720 [Burkholderia ubonensis]|nr:hypothetical protein WI84_07720 [Burkholderia ubonensis]